MEKLSGMAAHAARRVERLKAESSVEALRAAPGYARKPRPVPADLGGRVADLRFADPEKGLLVAGGEVSAENAARRAKEAAAGGATALAVWTERNFHAGDYAHLDAIRAACPETTIVMMDYVVDPWQLERARAGGADAVLLLPDLLGPYLGRLVEFARSLGLSCVVPGPSGVRVL